MVTVFGDATSTAVAVPILLYHSVSWYATPRYRDYAITPDNFAAHMAYLSDHNYTPLTVTQFVTACVQGTDRLPERLIILTFDDGLADFYSGALPILNRYNFGATLYLATGFIGRTSRWLVPEGEGDRPMMTWAQVAEVSSYGIECGAHSQSHRQLDTLPLGAAQQEIQWSKDTLEDHLGREVQTFSYPHGYYSGAVRRLVQQAGYTSACAVKRAMSSTTDDRFGLARIAISADVDVAKLDTLLRSDRVPVAPPYERLPTTGWRLVRRSAAAVRRGLRLEKTEVM